MRVVLLCLALVAGALAADLSHEVVIRMADGRQYAISNPQQAVPGLPLILYFHGINTPCTRVTGDILDASAAQNFPALIGSVCGVNGAWDTNGRSDIDYTNRVINDIVTRYAIDRSKVFLTGWSMGGMMCSKIACSDGGMAAGIAMVDCAFTCSNFAVKTNLMGVEAIYDSVCVNWISPAYASWATAYGCPSAGSGDTRRQTCSGKFLDLDRLPAGHNYIDVPNQVAFFKRIAGVSAPCDSNPCAAGQLCTNTGATTYTCGVNIAVGATASMSSVGNFCSGSNAPCLASYAVDGDYSQTPNTGKCAHSGSNTGAQWWRVDLGTAQTFNQVRLYLRTDCCTERASAYAVYVSNSETAGDASAVQIGTISQQQPTQVYSFVVPAGTAAARYVEVRATNQWLAVCEVAVITTPNPCASAPCANGGTCTASSSGYTCACQTGFGGATCQTCTAGFTQFPDSDAPNNDLKTIWGVTSYADCQTQCTQTTGCVMFTFNAGLKGCWVKSKFGTGAAAAGFTAGVCSALITAPLPCASNPCKNGGACANSLAGSYSCACPAIFSGADCSAYASVAQLKTASQSGDGSWCSGTNAPCLASYAVDNDYSQTPNTGKCAHTGSCTGNQWWRVDLGANYHVSQVSLYLRTDCCQTRVVGYGVFLTNSTAALDANAVSIGAIAAQTSNQVYTFTVPAATAVAEYIEVRAQNQCLTICEAAVLGTQA